jgi:hypothetical protein
MTAAATVVRAILVGFGLLVMLTGALALVAVPESGGLLFVLGGGVLVAIVALERGRYRSSAAELSNATIGPGGGEIPGPLEPRFRRTDEVFVDPTTRRVMRVLVDPATGERRYVAEDPPR